MMTSLLKNVNGRKRVLAFAAMTVTACFLLMSAFCPQTASADEPANLDYKIYIQDDADLLTDSQEATLRSELEQLRAYGNMAFVTVPKGGNGYSSTAVYVDQLYGSLIGYKVTGVMFCIDMEYRQIYLYSNGALYDEISVSDCDSITDNVYTYASDQNYYKCASKTFEQVYTLLSTGVIKRPMMKILVILLSLFLSAFINFIVLKIVMRVKNPSDYELAEAANARFSATEAQAHLTSHSRTYSPVSSSSGGSSGGGGGGGFSGGGGGGGGHGGGHGF